MLVLNWSISGICQLSLDFLLLCLRISLPLRTLTQFSSPLFQFHLHLLLFLFHVCNSLGELASVSLRPKVPTHLTLDTWVLTSFIQLSTYHFSFCFQAHRAPWNCSSMVVSPMLNYKSTRDKFIPSFTQIPLKRKFTFLIF